VSSMFQKSRLVVVRGTSVVPPWGSGLNGPFHWFNQPGQRHGRGANLSFLDGHVDHHRWLYTPKGSPAGDTPPVNALDKEDLMWLINRTHGGQYRLRVLGLPLP